MLHLFGFFRIYTIIGTNNHSLLFFRMSSRKIPTPLRMEPSPNSSVRMSFKGRKKRSAASSIALKCKVSYTVQRKNISSVCTGKPE